MSVREAVAKRGRLELSKGEGGNYIISYPSKLSPGNECRIFVENVSMTRKRDALNVFKSMPDLSEERLDAMDGSIIMHRHISKKKK